jgi:membrane-associated phospholipid phosphatase
MESPQPKSKALYFVMVGVSVASAVVFVIDLSLKPQLLDNGAHFTEDIQTSRTTFGDVFFSVFAELCLVLLLAVPVLDYLVFSPQRGFRGLMLALHVIYLTDLLKIIYSDPRPYWKYAEVEGVNCATGWGNPSGHSSLSIAMTVFYSFHFAQVKGRDLQVWTVCGLFVGLVGFDRLYLGVHFYSQVLLGWALGLSLTLAYIYFDDLVSKLYRSTLSIKSSVWFWTAHAAVLSALVLLVYLLRDPYWSSDWTKNIDEDCTQSITKNSTESQSLHESSVICVFSGLAVSLQLCSSRVSGNWLESVSCKHSVMKCLFVGVADGLVFLARYLLLLAVPTSTGKFLVSAVLGFVGGCVTNWSVLLASCYVKGSRVETAGLTTDFKL